MLTRDKHADVYMVNHKIVYAHKDTQDKNMLNTSQVHDHDEADDSDSSGGSDYFCHADDTMILKIKTCARFKCKCESPTIISYNVMWKCLGVLCQ